MKMIFLVVLLVLNCHHQVKTIMLKLPDNFNGWVFVIENDEKVLQSNGAYVVSSAGVVYIPRNAATQAVKFRLHNNDDMDVSKNVRLFHKSVYQESDVNRKRNFYNFYYPSVEELELSPDVWQDIDFYEKYNVKGVSLQQAMEKKGYFD